MSGSGLFFWKNGWERVIFVKKWVGVGYFSWKMGGSGWERLGVGESGWERNSVKPAFNESSDHDRLASMTYLQKVLGKIEEQYEKV